MFIFPDVVVLTNGDTIDTVAVVVEGALLSSVVAEHKTQQHYPLPGVPFKSLASADI